MNGASNTKYHNVQERLTIAMSSAIEQYELLIGHSFEHDLTFEVTRDDGFWALAQPLDEGIQIRVSTGAVHAIDALWQDAWGASILRASKGQRTQNFKGFEHTPERLADVSLMWLLLHELMHIVMGHVDLLEGAALVETASARPFTDTKKPDGMISALRQVPDADKPFLSRCMEMQADSEATDILLEAYSDEQWGELRARAAAIFVVMALIERENDKSDREGITHPKAATRFFTLLAHLFQMWLYPNAELEQEDGELMVSTPDAPDPEKFEKYASDVLIPAVNDALIISKAAGAKSFLDGIGDHVAILHDISTVQYAEGLSADNLKTDGAREWLELMGANQRIMAALNS